MDIEKFLDRMQEYRAREGALPPGFREGIRAAIARLTPPVRAEVDKLAAQLDDDNAGQVLPQIRAALDRVAFVDTVPE